MRKKSSARGFHRTTPGPGRQTNWDRVAGWYDALVGQKGSDYHRTIVIPGVMRLLAMARGARVIDVGCGQGVLCRELAATGVRVLGCDASAELIEAARRRSGKGEARYEVLDAQRLATLPAASFDGASCVLAIQNMEPFEPVITGCAHVLEPGAPFVLVMTHPAFRIPRQTGWGWDETRKLQYRRVDHYLSPLKVPIQAHPGADPDVYTWSFHRPLQDYVKALSAAGLWIDALEEWASDRTSQPGPKAKGENRSREEIPLFMAIRARKAK